MASTTTLWLAGDDAISVVPGMRVYGSTSGSSGYTIDTNENGDEQWYYIGSQSYSWDRTNTDSTTYTGYWVDTTATDPIPDSGTYSYFPTTATVHWGSYGIGGDSGGGQ